MSISMDVTAALSREINIDEKRLTNDGTTDDEILNEKVDRRIEPYDPCAL